ncbi:unnamed protein product [Didymodactylos carnosus]|uniref:Potassium channel domain-containing protein n=1 Tax=Didymodactylos carnosus TaxID=1234261 RepID=A0A815QD36_9BILA|nr:unnamed protein product [Didymodactylos carnosus]CAF4331604.1 unnamed protein product [Didymodactylos carnosus]
MDIRALQQSLANHFSVGERLNNFAGWGIKTIKRCFKLRDYDATQTELVVVGSCLAVGVVTGGAAMFHHFEQWTYFDCIYYCFITLTTIGFGDFVALQKDQALSSNPLYVVLAMTFILFGLTVVASSMNLLVLRFLTMNTEDERREEIESQVRNSLRFDSDVITTANGDLRILAEHLEYLSNTSDSKPCNCFGCLKRKKKRYTVRRSPGKIAHLIPLQRMDSVITGTRLRAATGQQESIHASNEIPRLDQFNDNRNRPYHRSVSSSTKLPLMSSEKRISSENALLPTTASSIHSVRNDPYPTDISQQTRLSTVLTKFRQRSSV